MVVKLLRKLLRVQCAAKISIPYFCHFAIFLASAWNFDMKFYVFITYSYARKNAKRHFIIFNCSKVIEFLSDHAVTSDVRRMFAERNTRHICTVTQKIVKHNK